MGTLKGTRCNEKNKAPGIRSAGLTERGLLGLRSGHVPAVAGLAGAFCITGGRAAAAMGGAARYRMNGIFAFDEEEICYAEP